MLVSVEIPVFHHHYLAETIESVLSQTYENWQLLMLSDGATMEAQQIMQKYSSADKSARIHVFYQDNKGISASRKRLTDLSKSDLIIPLDHDDLLLPTALEEMVICFKEHKKAGIVRSRRNFIDCHSNPVEQEDWFPFLPRTYSKKMTTDVFNHSQPYMIRRSAYEQTAGWSGFEKYAGAGEDCDIFLKIEEVSEIYLLDKYLYSYRLSDQRTSHRIGREGAKEMWNLLADQSIKRRGLPIKRVNDMPPFIYETINTASNEQ